MSEFNLDIYCKGNVLYHNQKVEMFIFPGGEVSVAMPKDSLMWHNFMYITINATITDSDGVMALLLIKDAINNAFKSCNTINLNLGYIPYARQDRICNKGEAFSAKVFANLINSMNFNSVKVVDPHSDVIVGLLNNVTHIVRQEDMLKQIPAISVRLYERKLTLVSPDLGATKKTQDVSKAFGGIEIIQATKERDLATGELSGFNYYGDVTGKDLLIVDDICDGGGTFIGLAEKLIFGGAASVSLFVSHGIFSKGIDILMDNGIDCVYTTDTFPSGCEHEFLFALKNI